eukprot:c38045_g1_i1 orf=2-325(-)
MQCSCDSHITSTSGESNNQASSISRSSNIEGDNKLERLAGENAVVIFTLSSCCMCDVVCRLLCSLGVNPTIHEVDDDIELQQSLLSLPLCDNMQSELHSCSPPPPPPP